MSLKFGILLAALVAAIAGFAAPPPFLQPAEAASSAFCEGGNFTVTLPNGRVLSGSNGWKIGRADLPSHSLAHVSGKYVQFDVDVSTFAVYNYSVAGQAIFASKVPDLNGATLDAGELEVKLFPQGGELRRRGGAGMKLQLKDCYSGGIFQMEADQQTVYTHTLAPGIFYFNNPLTGKINFGDGADLIGKDSPMVATKLSQSGTVSTWRVEAGGRMGMVLGEDAIELAPGSPNCVQQCQVQNQIQGTLPVPGQ